MGKRIDRAAIKAEARGLIRTGRRSVIGAGAVYFGVTLVLSLLQKGHFICFPPIEDRLAACMFL